jgi:hypothetical protein
MNQVGRALSLLVVAAALASSCSDVFAKSGAGGGHPTQVKTSGTSAAPAPVSGPKSKVIGSKYVTCAQDPSAARCQALCYTHPSADFCRPGHSQPTCRGPHRGPNGVMVQCD